MGQPRPQPGGSGLPPEAAEVSRLIAKGNSKSAVEAAKLLHKRLGTPATEALLVEAYCARADSLLGHRLAAEAQALVAMVRQRHPAFASRLDSQRAAMTGAGAGLEELLRPLADPAASPEARMAVESALRTELSDPAVLARSPALEADHPLRVGAEALRKALDAVTSGRLLGEDALALPEISRRSPLAPWKPLLRAIACYYREEDEACREHLRAIEPRTAPARLAPALEVLLGQGDARQLKPAAATLVSSVRGNLEGVRSALAALDHAFEADAPPKSAFQAIRAAAALVQQECPETLVAFRRQVSVLAMLADIGPAPVIAALGGPPRQDARYYLMQARALEREESQQLLACHMWEFFHRSAVAEKWFPARGPETATLFLHMAELAQDIPAEDLDEDRRAVQEMVRREAPEGFVPDEPGFEYLDAGWLYEQACAMDPHAQAFERWIGWARKHSTPQAAEAAAAAWRQALPEDARPLLHLMRLAEERDALKKALGYLRQAETLDGVNVEVRRARLRLLIHVAVRHLKQRKPHLAEAELAELEALPQARENDRPAFVAALRWTAAAMAEDEAQARLVGATVRQLLGSDVACLLMLAAAGALCQVDIRFHPEETKGAWIEALPRIHAIGSDLGFKIMPPEEYKDCVREELRSLPAPDPAALERLGKTALDLEWPDIAYVVSGVGFERTKNHEARFLLLRARALSGFSSRRQEDCIVAAANLARRANDLGLAGEADKLWRETSMGAMFGEDMPEWNQPRIQRVLARERKAKNPPDKFDALEDIFDSFDTTDPYAHLFPRGRRGRGRGPDRRPRKPRQSVVDDQQELPF